MIIAVVIAEVIVVIIAVEVPAIVVVIDVVVLKVAAVHKCGVRILRVTTRPCAEMITK